MKIIRITIFFLIIATLLGCSFTVNVPKVDTTVTRTLKIDEKAPSSDSSSLNIEMGAGVLNLSGGAESLVEGTVLYNVESWKPAVSVVGNTITIEQKNTTNVGVPDGTIKNVWDLKIGPTPLEFSLATGASETNLELGGLALTEVRISDGASKSSVNFASPNPVEMSLLSYRTGASSVELTKLGNANVSEVMFESGVGSYKLDFSGDLKKDIDVNIRSGMSDVKILIPEGTHTIVTIDGGLSNVDLNGTWTVTNGIYETGTSTHTIEIKVEMAMGNLQLLLQ